MLQTEDLLLHILRPLWSSEQHNHCPCRKDLKGQWVPTEDSVGNGTSIIWS